MKIIVEANIPYIKGLLEAFGEVEYLPAAEINAGTVKKPTRFSSGHAPGATAGCFQEAV